MNAFTLYVDSLIPKYHEMNESLNSRVIGRGEIKRHTLDMAGYLNNMVDFIAHERASYIRDSWNAIKATQFRDALEKGTFTIGGQSYSGQCLGIVRDLANVSKHKKIGRTNALINDIEEVKECIMMIRYEDEIGYYYGTNTTAVAKLIGSGYVPCEIPIALTFQLFTDMLVNLEILPAAPSQLPSIRGFYRSRNQVENASECEIDVQEKMVGAVILRDFIYEDANPLKLRSRKTEDEFQSQNSFKLGVAYSGEDEHLFRPNVNTKFLNASRAWIFV